MFDAESGLFARILVYPTHFRDKDRVSFACFVPRSYSDKDGISIFNCAEIKFDFLIKQGELIVNNQKKRENIPELYFYGCVFMLGKSILENFDLFQKGQNKSHFLMKHKRVDYCEPFPRDDVEIAIEHNYLLEESIIIPKKEMIELSKKHNFENIIYEKFLLL